MKYALTQHAIDSLSERGISLEWMERVLNNPQKTEADRDDPALTHHLGSIPEHGNRVPRVIFNATTDPPRIITVFFDRKLKGQL